MQITKIAGRSILDSRGNPTVEADVWVDNQFAGRASVPSGASTGEYEAHELRDGGEHYHGQGVEHAVANINETIADLLIGKAVDNQTRIDELLRECDGTDNKSSLGANSILAVSLACAHAAAKARGVLLYQHIKDIARSDATSLPMPMMNILNGGRHASNSADFQEFMIIPMQATTYRQAIQIGSEIFQSLKMIIAEAGNSTAVGDEGGFTYPVRSNSEMLDLLNMACTKAGYKPGQDIGYALDIAASEFYTKSQYALVTENRRLSANDMQKYVVELTQNYPLLSIEDALDQNMWSDWQSLAGRLPTTQLVGDDLLVTNPKRLQRAIDEKAGNAILIKPNQIGTLSETIETIKLAQQHGWNTVVSHRSGETEDVTIAHLAVGTGAGQIKTGSLSRGERTAKHNELMRLEEIDKSLKLHNPFTVS